MPKGPKGPTGGRGAESRSGSQGEPNRQRLRQRPIDLHARTGPHIDVDNIPGAEFGIVTVLTGWLEQDVRGPWLTEDRTAVSNLHLTRGIQMNREREMLQHLRDSLPEGFTYREFTLGEGQEAKRFGRMTLDLDHVAHSEDVDPMRQRVLLLEIGIPEVVTALEKATGQKPENPYGIINATFTTPVGEQDFLDNVKAGIPEQSNVTSIDVGRQRRAARAQELQEPTDK